MLTTTQPMRSDRFEIIFSFSNAIQYTVKPCCGYNVEGISNFT